MCKRTRKRSVSDPGVSERTVGRDKFDRQFVPPDTGNGSGEHHVETLKSLHKLWCEHRRLEYKLRAFTKRREASWQRMDLLELKLSNWRRKFAACSGRLLQARFEKSTSLDKEPVGGLRVVEERWAESVLAYQPADFGAPPSLADTIVRDRDGNALVTSSARLLQSMGASPDIVEESKVNVGLSQQGAFVRLSNDPHSGPRFAPENPEVAFDRWRGQWPNTLGRGSAENPARVENLVATPQVVAAASVASTSAEPVRKKPKCLFCHDLLPQCVRCGSGGPKKPRCAKCIAVGRDSCKRCR